MSFHCLLLLWVALALTLVVRGASDPGSFQILASALGPKVCEDLSISHSPPGLLKVSYASLESQTIRGLIFPVQDSYLGNLMWNLDPSLFGENLCNYKYPPVCLLPTGWVGVLSIPCSIPPTYLIVVLLYIFSCRSVFFIVAVKNFFFLNAF